MTREGCEHPQNAAGTAYNKGCRCDGCREAMTEKRRRYYEANREAIAEKDRRYYEANREAIAERGRRYREANREAIAEKDRRHYEANREAIAEKDRRYYEANREAVAERGRRYREANYKACRRAARMTREKYARLLPATVSGRFSPAEDKVILAWEGTGPQLAAALGRTYESVRHRQAILREKGLLL